jgi:hypothetical protein
MTHQPIIATLAAAVLVSACASGGGGSAPATSAPPPKGPASFFITSAGSGDGANLGGLAGADAHCQKLAAAAGYGAKSWRAYLSTSGALPANNNPGTPAVHARDRIGAGPWFNVNGVLIARDLAHLHNGNAISKQNAVDEKGKVVNGRGDTPNEHDILTGSRADGTAFAPQTDTTCKNWTSNNEGSAVVGHHDLTGPTNDSWAKSWNFSHQSRGCSQPALVATGGSGRFYCFATN